ncbi:pathogenesis-related protein PRMS-like [Phoenix dactylifera]|uniref:Pathogenesis-related protein PRMS-like n=1 Tax=Phoenix dactylifera TaxID=42345 RepID=A0A8B7CLI8_PHODC|nr:pathogenesis-related protein PRMS-like [Phoenix dactylifera]
MASCSWSPRLLPLLLLPIFILSISTATFGLPSATNGASTDNASLERISPAATVSQFVAAHNAARRQVGVPPLSWDPKLAKVAKAYAARRRRDCRLVHSPGFAYGENIFWGAGRRWSTTDVVAAWVGEKQWYDYKTNSCSGPDCTHYTQVVWRTTERLGCARILCDTGDTFAACEYHPPGNYVGVRPY